MYVLDFQVFEGCWCGLKMFVLCMDFCKNVCIEVFDVLKEVLQCDFEDFLELIQSGLYCFMYIEEYDMLGGQLISVMISDFEFVNLLMDVVLLCNILKVVVVVYMLFIGLVGVVFFGKKLMEEVVFIQDIGNYFDCVEYIKWKSFCDIDDVCYVGLMMLCVFGCLLYGKDMMLVCVFNYEEVVKGLDYDKYLWVNVLFVFVVNMVCSFVSNGWCVQI